METTKEIHLKLTEADMVPGWRGKPILQPKFYHFMENRTAKEFQEATLITFTGKDGNEIVIKDLFNRRTK